MRVVTDTNAFLAVILNEPEKVLIVKLTKGTRLVAPDVLPYEIGNALTAMLKKHILKEDEMLSVWEAVLKIPVELRNIDFKSALKIAAQFNIYAYDAYFLECALRLNKPLLTLDKRMKEIALELNIQLLEVTD